MTEYCICIHSIELVEILPKGRAAIMATKSQHTQPWAQVIELPLLLICLRVILFDVVISIVLALCLPFKMNWNINSNAIDSFCYVVSEWASVCAMCDVRLCMNGFCVTLAPCVNLLAQHSVMVSRALSCLKVWCDLTQFSFEQYTDIVHLSLHPSIVHSIAVVCSFACLYSISIWNINIEIYCRKLFNGLRNLFIFIFVLNPRGHSIQLLWLFDFFIFCYAATYWHLHFQCNQI